jgi:serine/threonine-protein kinase
MDAAQIAMYDLRSNTSKVLFRGGSHARYVSTGHLVYSTQGALRAVPFDLRRLEISGPSVPVEEVALTPYAAGAGFFDIANDGTLVYAQRGDRGGDRGGDRAVVWVDRHGHEESVPLPPRAYRQARLSPDGTRIVLFPGLADDSLWMWDLRRPALIRLTSGSDTDQSPVWTPDGQHVVFASTRDGVVYNLWRQATNGAGSPERLTTGPVIQFPTGITPDGTHLVFHQTTATGRDVMRLALDRTRAVTPLVQTPDDERNGIISADGHWLAYDSNSSGRFEVYVRPFPDTAAGFCLVSTTGGTRPVWSHQGKELFFSALDGAIMGVAIETTGTTCRAATPSKLIEPGYVLSGGGNVIRAFDVSTDDQRLLMIKGPTAGSDSAPPSVLVVVQNWTQELMRLVPQK